MEGGALLHPSRPPRSAHTAAHRSFHTSLPATLHTATTQVEHFGEAEASTLALVARAREVLPKFLGMEERNAMEGDGGLGRVVGETRPKCTLHIMCILCHRFVAVGQISGRSRSIKFANFGRLAVGFLDPLPTQNGGWPLPRIQELRNKLWIGFLQKFFPKFQYSPTL